MYRPVNSTTIATLLWSIAYLDIRRGLAAAELVDSVAIYILLCTGRGQIRINGSPEV